MEITQITGQPDFTNLRIALKTLPPGSDNFDLVGHLVANGALKERGSTKLANWPPMVQKYITKELRNYIKDKNGNYPDSDLQVIDQFLQTAMQGDATEGTSYSDEDWAKAMNAMAHELRRYYGLQENNEELPCWRYG
jgi:hypothetical protein